MEEKMTELKKLVLKYLKEAICKIENDSTEWSDEQMMKFAQAIAHIPMSKEQSCNYLNLSRSRFDDLVRENKIPRGRKRAWFKELVWYRDELDICKRQ